MIEYFSHDFLYTYVVDKTKEYKFASSLITRLCFNPEFFLFVGWIWITMIPLLIKGIYFYCKLKFNVSHFKRHKVTKVVEKNVNTHPLQNSLEHFVTKRLGSLGWHHLGSTATAYFPPSQFYKFVCNSIQHALGANVS